MSSEYGCHGNVVDCYSSSWHILNVKQSLFSFSFFFSLSVGIFSCSKTVPLRIHPAHNKIAAHNADRQGIRLDKKNISIFLIKIAVLIFF